MGDRIVRDEKGLRLIDCDGTVEGSWTSLAQWAAAWVLEYRSTQAGVAPAIDLDMLLRFERPAWQLEAVLALVDAADAEELGMVGAGPLEDLIRCEPMGEDLLTVIDDLAQRSPRFRSALSGVWLGDDVPEVARNRLAELGARDFVAEAKMTRAALKVYFADRRERGLFGQGDPKPEDATTHPS